MQPALPSGVHVFERGWLSSNNILLSGTNSAALVDSGYVSHAPQTLALVEHALGTRALDLLVNTHLHSDHCGGNAALQRRYPALRTLIPPGEAAVVRDWDEERLSYRATGQECPRFDFDATLQAGSTIDLADRSWEVHCAPGHDPHAVVLYEPAARLLISGDALWEKGFGIVFPEMWGEPSFDQVAATLDLIEGLRPLVVVPGHGRVFRDLDGALRTARERLEKFVGAPDRHARHAIKVLLKFKLLDAKQISRGELQTWVGGASYAELVRQRFAPQSSLGEWTSELLGELALSRAARIDGDQIFDAP